MIEVDALVHVGGEQIEMIDAQRFYAPVLGILLRDVRQSIHLEIKLYRYAVVINSCQGSTLKGAFDPANRLADRFEISVRLIELLFIEYLVGEISGRCFVGLGQNDRVVTTLFHGAQKNLATVFMCDLQTQCIDVEMPASVEISNLELDVA